MVAAIDKEDVLARESEGAGGQYLTFMLAGEEYGVEILKVQEIKGWSRATPIPRTPAHVLGVMNLRGAVVPIVDMRKRFGLDSIEYGPTTVVIVVRMAHDDQQRTVGLVVDAVADVYRLDGETIQAAPDMGDNRRTEFVNGLATVDEKMVILLDVDRLLDLNDIAPVEGADAATGKSDERSDEEKDA